MEVSEVCDSCVVWECLQSLPSVVSSVFRMQVQKAVTGIALERSEDKVCAEFAGGVSLLKPCELLQGTDVEQRALVRPARRKKTNQKRLKKAAKKAAMRPTWH